MATLLFQVPHVIIQDFNAFPLDSGIVLGDVVAIVDH
jgi:hypothetical protein